jgi:signal transduction histidine kinase
MRDVKESKTLINNVRKLHRTLSNDLPIETMDLDGVIKYALNEVQWPETKEVDIRYSPQMGRAINGTEILKDVFYTLVNNAVSCSRGPVAIDLGVDKIHVQEQPYYMVTVSDNSQQIPDEVKSELFMFHQGLTQSYGKALPMFLVKLIVDRMGGDIRVEDRVPGDYKQGSEFIITLPAIEGPVIPEPEPSYP